MEPQVSTFEIRVLSRGVGSWIDEAVVIIDGADQLAGLGRADTHHGSAWIGMAPDDLLGADSPLSPSQEPFDATVARCGCGELACGALIARISTNDEQVIWDRFRRGSTVRSEQYELEGGPFVFDRRRYERALVGAAEADSDWEPHTRQAVEIANAAVAGWRDEDLRLLFAGCEHVNDDEVLLRAFFGSKGDDDRAMLRRVVHRASGESATDMADRIVGYVQSGGILDDDEVSRRAI